MVTNGGMWGEGMNQETAVHTHTLLHKASKDRERSTGNST